MVPVYFQAHHHEAHLLMAGKGFAIVDQLSELLRARIQPLRCQDSDRCVGMGVAARRIHGYLGDIEAG
jgi:hypothetical protein